MSLQICISFFAIYGGSSIWWGLGCVGGVAVGGWLQSFEGYLGPTLILMLSGAIPEEFNFYFSVVFG